MSSYILSCESTCDMTKEQLDERNIKYVSFSYQVNGKDYLDDFGQSLPFEDFYRLVGEGADTKTSQVNVARYEEFFASFLSQGLDIVHICFSSGLSGTINSARNAAALLRDEYPERKIYIVDSLAASMGYGLILDTAASMRDQGKDASELVLWLEENKLKLNSWFFSTDLSTYVRGGRISKAAAFFGGALQICPLLNMDNQGRLVPREKIRTKKRVIREIVDRMHQFADDRDDYSGKCFITQSLCYDDARAVADLVEAEFPKLNGKVVINWVGTTIGAHTGPNTVALFFWGDERKE